MKQDPQNRISSETLFSPQKISAFFPIGFNFYSAGKVELLKHSATLKDIAHCNFITGIRVIGEESGYFLVGVMDSKIGINEESMYQELANILAGKFVNLVSEQTTAHLTIEPPESIRSLVKEKSLMMEFLKKSEENKALVEPYLFRSTSKNIKLFAAFIPSSTKLKAEN